VAALGAHERESRCRAGTVGRGILPLATSATSGPRSGSSVRQRSLQSAHRRVRPRRRKILVATAKRVRRTTSASTPGPTGERKSGGCYSVGARPRASALSRRRLARSRDRATGVRRARCHVRDDALVKLRRWGDVGDCAPAQIGGRQAESDGPLRRTADGSENLISLTRLTPLAGPAVAAFGGNSDLAAEHHVAERAATQAGGRGRWLAGPGRRVKIPAGLCSRCQRRGGGGREAAVQS
jgi:hypothetical protein